MNVWHARCHCLEALSNWVSERYWKIPELWECNLRSPVAAGTAAEQVLACLISAMNLASGWCILGSLSADSADGFNGVFTAGQGKASGSADVTCC